MPTGKPKDNLNSGQPVAWLVGAVEETVQPEHASLWLRRREGPERE